MSNPFSVCSHRSLQLDQPEISVSANIFEMLWFSTLGWKILVRKNPFGGEAGKSFERTSLILNWPPGAVLYKSRCVCVFGPLNFGVCAMCVICSTFYATDGAMCVIYSTFYATDGPM